MGDSYNDIYRVSASEEWVNGAYDEYGNQIHCDACHDDLHWDPETRNWYCRSCGSIKTRAQWFDYIEADPPGHKCLSMCQENYPMCKNWCMIYEIPDDDPIL